MKWLQKWQVDVDGKMGRDRERDREKVWSKVLADWCTVWISIDWGSP